MTDLAKYLVRRVAGFIVSGMWPMKDVPTSKTLMEAINNISAFFIDLFLGFYFDHLPREHLIIVYQDGPFQCTATLDFPTHKK